MVRLGKLAKLTRKEAEKVAELYDLGDIISYKYVQGGLINYNFDFKTDKGSFMVRRLGYKLAGYWKRQKAFEYSIVSYLHKKKLPFMIPDFMRNRNGKYISAVGKSLFEVYPKIPGEKISTYNDKQLKEVAKAAAIYHKAIKGHKGKIKDDDFEWILRKYAQIRRLKPNNKLNRLALENVDFFESLLKHLLGMDLRKDLVIGHRYMHRNNLLFDGNRLVGILDFENLGGVSKMNDLTFILEEEKPSSWGMFIKEYKRHGSLLKGEDKKLILFILIHKCNIFWWQVLGMRKTPELKYKRLRYTVNFTKRMLRKAKMEKSWKF